MGDVVESILLSFADKKVTKANKESHKNSLNNLSYLPKDNSDFYDLFFIKI